MRRPPTWALGAFALSLALAGSWPASAARVTLPASVTPDGYRLDIVPDAAALTFQGSVEIDVTVHSATDEIVLNSADLVIDAASLAGDGAAADGAAAPAIRYDAAAETLTLRLAHGLAPGAYTLKLAYHGRIRENASGLFALDYATPAGRARALFTQFENSDARRFVPSWDEPARKATFALTATVPADSMAISNMPVAASEVLPDGRKRVHFATTPRMSSYLLFFGMGDFERVARTVDGVDVGVVMRRGDAARAKFALDAATDLLGYYGTYFGIRYPLPKLDLIGAPGTSQFFSAMENWGAILFFERDLLTDDRVSTEADRQDVYITVAHEMAHQWFGDLVTMAWWDDLWLNEGFASWMESKVTDHFHPEWRVWLQTLQETERTMQEDARSGTHPIVTPIDDVLQAGGAFDSITYTKGAAVIRMLESYVGEDAFRAGVRRYLQEHAYGNTTSDDLWRAMDRDNPRPISGIAHDFTLQAGVPMVTETGRACRGGRTTLRLVQGHFAIDAGSTAARTWRVPMSLATQGGEPVTTVVAGPVAEAVTADGCGAPILNAGRTGYFRSRYSRQGFADTAAVFAVLPPDDQLGFLNDGSSLALSGQGPLVPLLELMRNFPADADPVVAGALIGLFQDLDRLHDGLPTQPAFRGFARRVLEPLFARAGWQARPGEDANEPLLRANLAVALGEFEDPAVLAEAHRRFERYRSDPATLDAAGRQAVLAIVAADADTPTWERLHDMARAAPTEIEREQLYDLLATATNPALARAAMDLALSGEPPATVSPEMIAVASHRHPASALEFTMAHWDRRVPLLETDSRAQVAPNLLRHASDLALIGKLGAFAARSIPASARQDVRKADATVRYRAAVRRLRLPEIDRWLAATRQSGLAHQPGG